MITSAKRFQIFGDESQFSGVVTYAFVIVPSKLQQDVEQEIAKVKSEFGLKATDEIHCRELFNVYAKEKTAFRHLSKEEIFLLLQKVTISIYLAGARAWIGYLNTSTAPDELIFEDDAEKRTTTTWDIRDIKLRMLFAYRAAIAPLTDFIPHNDMAAWVDGDTSRVAHIDGSRQIDTLRSFFPINHNDTKFFPTAVLKDKPVVLEIADAIAYSAAHGLSDTYTKDKPKFVSIVKSLYPGYSEVIFDIPNGGPMMSARVHDPDDTIKSYIKSFMAA